MIIRNKFNGYSRDGIRLYFDPATILALSKAAAATTTAAAPTLTATTAVAAPTIAAAAPTIAATVAPSVAQTTALEASKQQIIQGAMQQQAAQAATQQGLGQAATQQVGTEAAKQGLGQAATQQGAQQVGNEAARNQVIEAFKTAQNQPNTFTELGKYAGEVTPGSLPNVPNIPPRGDFLSGQGSALPSSVTNAPTMPPVNPVDATAQQSLKSSAERGFQEYTAREAAANMNPLEKGIQTGVDLVKKYPMETGATLMVAGQYLNQPKSYRPEEDNSTVDMSEFSPSSPSVRPYTPIEYAAKGGLMGYAVGGPVEQMAAMNSVGANTGYPMAQLQTPLYSNPVIQRPEATNVISSSGEPAVGSFSGEQKFREGGISEATAREYGLKTRKQRASRGLMDTYEGMEKERTKTMAEVEALGRKFDVGTVPRSRTQQLSGAYSAAQKELESAGKRYKVPVAKTDKTSLGDVDDYLNTPVEAARGGIMGDLGSYSDGGRLLRGPGDGVSDSIPAVIGKRQPARLADGEFVIPARIVSELGNGSTEAGARKLYAMMERIQSTRRKSIGKKKVAVNSRADKHLPA